MKSHTQSFRKILVPVRASFNMKILNLISHRIKYNTISLMSSPTVPQSSCLLIFSLSIMHKLNIHPLHWKVTEASNNDCIFCSWSRVSFSTSAAITIPKTGAFSLQRNHKSLLCKAPIRSPRRQSSLIKGHHPSLFHRYQLSKPEWQNQNDKANKFGAFFLVLQYSSTQFLYSQTAELQSQKTKKA